MTTNKRRNRASSNSKGLVQPQRLQLQGQGDYLADMRDLVAQSKTAVAAAKGAIKAAKAINKVPNKGAIARKLIKSFTGFGDYHGPPMTSNSLINPTTATTGAEFSHQGRRGTRVTESEFVGDVRSGVLVGGSTEFTNQVFSVNPANAALFPWLSSFAALYDQWEPQGIIFEFRTTSSTFNGTSQALGVVIAAVDYDPSDPPYATKQAMENADYAVSSVSSSGLLLGLECSPAERPVRVMYTGAPPVTSSSPSKTFYDLGTLQLATQGMSTEDVTVGELWVHYDIVFYKKQLPPPQLTPFQILPWGKLSGTTSPTTLKSITSGLDFVGGNGLIASYSEDSGDIIISQPGSYLITGFIAVSDSPTGVNYKLLGYGGSNEAPVTQNPDFVFCDLKSSGCFATFHVTSEKYRIRGANFDFASHHPIERNFMIVQIDQAADPF